MSLRDQVRAAAQAGPAALAVAAAVGLCMTLPASADAQTGGNAQAEQNRSLRQRLAYPGLPQTGRYMSESGQGFVLDRSASTTLLRFDRSLETWALRPTAAPRGDVLYRNDAGELVLRVSSDGNLTLYTRGNPGGSPVSLEGPADSLTPPVLGPVQLFNLMARRSALVTQSLGRLVEINLAGQQSEALVVDALIVTTDAVVRMARSPSARGYLGRLRQITIVEGERASAVYAREELRITVDPRLGLAGRPSSARIVRAFVEGQGS